MWGQEPSVGRQNRGSGERYFLGLSSQNCWSLSDRGSSKSYEISPSWLPFFHFINKFMNSGWPVSPSPFFCHFLYQRPGSRTATSSITRRSRRLEQPTSRGPFQPQLSYEPGEQLMCRGGSLEMWLPPFCPNHLADLSKMCKQNVPSKTNFPSEGSNKSVRVTQVSLRCSATSQREVRGSKGTTRKQPNSTQVLQKKLRGKK